MAAPLTPHRAVSAASDNNTLVKTGHVRLGLVRVNNTNATVRYLHLYDKATEPIAGTDTPVLTIPIPTGTAQGFDVPEGVYFQNGLGYSITTSISGASGAVSANEHVVSMAYRSVGGA